MVALEQTMMKEVNRENHEFRLQTESWNVSYTMFLIVGIAMDIVLIVIILLIIISIFNSRAKEDYFKTHFDTPKSLVINFTNVESTDSLINKEDVTVLTATKGVTDKRLRRTGHLQQSMVNFASEKMIYNRRASHDFTPRLPPMEEATDSQMSDTITPLQTRKNEKFRSKAEITKEKFHKVSQRQSSVLTLPPKPTTTYHWASPNDVHRHKARNLSKAESVQRGEPRVSPNTIQIVNETCESGERKKMKKSTSNEKVKIAIDNSSNASTLKTSQSNKTSKQNSETSRRMSSPNEYVIEKKDEILLSASIDMVRSEKTRSTSISGKNKQKKKNTSLADVESLSSEDYSLLGLKHGTIPAPKSEYHRKLVAVAMRCKIKEMQEKKLKEIKEMKERAQRTRQTSQGSARKKSSDSTSKSSKNKSPCGRHQLDSLSCEEVRRESLSEAVVEDVEKKVELQLEEGASSKADKKGLGSDGIQSRMSSPINPRDFDLLEKYGDLSEEELIDQASSIILSQGKLTEEEIMRRIEPIRRRWKLPDGQTSTDPTQTISTGGEVCRSPWEQNFRSTLHKVLKEAVGTERLSETFSSGISNPANQEGCVSELMSVSSSTNVRKSKQSEDSVDEFYGRKSPQEAGQKLKKSKGGKQIQEEEKSENDGDSESEESTSLLSESSISTMELRDLRKAPPMYRLSVTRSRHQKHNLKSKIRMHGETLREKKGPVPSTERCISISSGDTPTNKEITAMESTKKEGIKAIEAAEVKSQLDEKKETSEDSEKKAENKLPTLDEENSEKSVQEAPMIHVDNATQEEDSRSQSQSQGSKKLKLTPSPDTQSHKSGPIAYRKTSLTPKDLKMSEEFEERAMIVRLMSPIPKAKDPSKLPRSGEQETDPFVICDVPTTITQKESEAPEQPDVVKPTEELSELTSDSSTYDEKEKGELEPRPTALMITKTNTQPQSSTGKVIASTFPFITIVNEDKDEHLLYPESSSGKNEEKQDSDSTTTTITSMSAPSSAVPSAVHSDATSAETTDGTSEATSAGSSSASAIDKNQSSFHLTHNAGNSSPDMPTLIKVRTPTEKSPIGKSDVIPTKMSSNMSIDKLSMVATENSTKSLKISVKKSAIVPTEVSDCPTKTPGENLLVIQAEKSAKIEAEKSVKMIMEIPAEKTAKSPLIKPANIPAQLPDDQPLKNPEPKPENKPTVANIQVNTPSNIPAQTQDNVLLNTPANIQERKIGENVETMPKNKEVVAKVEARGFKNDDDTFASFHRHSGLTDYSCFDSEVTTISESEHL